MKFTPENPPEDKACIYVSDALLPKMHYMTIWLNDEHHALASGLIFSTPEEAVAKARLMLALGDEDTLALLREVCGVLSNVIKLYHVLGADYAILENLQAKVSVAINRAEAVAIPERTQP